MANIKGLTDSLDLGIDSGTLFARSGVEIRSLCACWAAVFRPFQSQAGVGDMYVTFSSLASKNYRYGKYSMSCIPATPLKPI